MILVRVHVAVEADVRKVRILQSRRGAQVDGRIEVVLVVRVDGVAMEGE